MNPQPSTSSSDAPAPKAPLGPQSSAPTPHCSTYTFPDRPETTRTHTRSASHGSNNITSNTVLGRPSALKTSAKQSGHQRSVSYGQIKTSETTNTNPRLGHSRVGSKTDFILPPGHKEDNDSNAVGGSASRTSNKGHSRQASRSESIYTLRRSAPPPLWRRLLCFLLRRSPKYENSEERYRIVVPNHTVPPKTPKKEHPNGRRPNNKVRTTKYTLLSFLPRNLLEQFHRVANLYFIFIVLLNWFPAINAFGKEIAMIPVLFVLGVTAVKDLFEDRRRHASDKRINNSTCRIYHSEVDRYKKVLWKEVRVGDLIHLSNNEVVPADILLLRSSDPNGLCYIDTGHLDGETNLKQRQVARGFLEKQTTFDPSKFKSYIEVDAPTTKIYRFHGALIHPSGERVPVGTDNLLLRECLLKNTDYIEGIVVYAGHETKAMLNNGGPRYKRSSLERQMNTDVIWCVIILILLCLVGAIGCKLWLSSYTSLVEPFKSEGVTDPGEAFLAFWTYIIILQIMIPLSLYVTLEMCKIIQVYHIHHNMDLYDPIMDKRTECRALNITEELGQIQYIFSDKTGTLTENRMIFRHCTIAGVDYNHPQLINDGTKGTSLSVVANPRMLSDLHQQKTTAETLDNLTMASKHSARMQEFLLLLAVCNTVVCSNHPHFDIMNDSGIIEPINNSINSSFSPSEQQHKDAAKESDRFNESQEPKDHFSGDLTAKDAFVNDLNATGTNNLLLATPKDRYTRLEESRSVTPSPPLNFGHSGGRFEVRRPPTHLPSLSPINSNENSPTTEVPQEIGNAKATRPKLLNISSLGFLGKKSPSNTNLTDEQKVKLNTTTATPSPYNLKPIFEAESPDELALVDAAYTYNCRLIKRTPNMVSVETVTSERLDFEILHSLPFDSNRKCMSVIVKHPVSKKIILYCKGADNAILSKLSPVEDDSEQKQIINQTQMQLNNYAKQGLRVLVMGKRCLSNQEYSEWARKHAEVELSHENLERKIRESYSQIESNLTLLGATGIEDRLQEGVPETLSSLISAGIVVWVLTGDKPETAINIAYSAKLFSPQMELLKLMARSKEAAESTIMFYLSEIEKGEEPNGAGSPSSTNVVENRQKNRLNLSANSSKSLVNSPSSCFGDRTSSNTSADESVGNLRGLSSLKNGRALVVDGKTLTFILDRRSNLTKPFLRLTTYCRSVLCCRATPLQKAYIVKVVKEELKMRTLAIGDGANDVSMIQTADVGIGISGQEGMQAVMASDFALSRFKYLEKFLLVHGHWSYNRLSNMVLYFFYKNAAFVFLIFWYQLYCGFSGAVMIDQMYLMLYNLLFTSLPPLAIGVYDQDAPEELLRERPYLYRRGRLSKVYKSYSFWLTMLDALYQSVVIFFICKAAYSDTDVDMLEFGTSATSACMSVMLCHAAIEIRSWTIIHVGSIVMSIGAFYVYSILYNSLCVNCFGLPSNYWIIQHAMATTNYWLVIPISCVLALLPRILIRLGTILISPDDVTRAILSHRRAVRQGEGFIVSWSRSTSTSSIYRTSHLRPKNSSLTEVG